MVPTCTDEKIADLVPRLGVDKGMKEKFRTEWLRQKRRKVFERPFFVDRYAEIKE